VLAGRHDFLSPSEHDAIIVDRMPNATLEIIERAGHNAHEEQSAEVLRILRRFLTSAHRGMRPPLVGV
jgi:pimeloyl-ACP methyl ester carboxylesterase